MTERTVTRDAGTGQFVSLDYAELNPDTTITQTVSVPDPHPIDLALAEIVRLTDSVPSLTLTAVPGVEVTGSDPQDVYEQALREIKSKLEEMNG